LIADFNQRALTAQLAVPTSCPAQNPFSWLSEITLFGALEGSDVDLYARALKAQIQVRRNTRRCCPLSFQGALVATRAVRSTRL